MKNVRKLVADVVELEKNITQLRSIHQADLEMKDAFYQNEKARVFTELQASYNAKLPELYAQQFEARYWEGYVEAECVAKGVRDSSTKEIVEPSYMGETRAQQEPVGEGTSELVAEETFSAGLDVVVVPDPSAKANVQPVSHS